MYYCHDLVGYIDSNAAVLSGSNVGVCVASCPTAAATGFACFVDTGLCTTGTFNPTYASTPVDSYCVPTSVSGVSISGIFDLNSY